MPKGGHFAALEQPDLLVKDIREFAKSLKIWKREGAFFNVFFKRPRLVYLRQAYQGHLNPLFYLQTF
jgi:hypothetical protein